MATLQATLPTVLYEWPTNAVLTLIERRRVYHPEFARTRQQHQRRLWRTIARDIRHTHNFRPSTGTI
jgi:hypothetical protein